MMSIESQIGDKQNDFLLYLHTPKDVEQTFFWHIYDKTVEEYKHTAKQRVHGHFHFGLRFIQGPEMSVD